MKVKAQNPAAVSRMPGETSTANKTFGVQADHDFFLHQMQQTVTFAGAFDFCVFFDFSVMMLCCVIVRWEQKDAFAHD